MAETRNTPVLRQVVEALTYSMPVRDIALHRLEQYFQNDYLLIVGNVESVAKAAEKLRLDINEDECGLLLNHIARRNIASITLDHVEAAAYELFGNRFIEPEN